MASTTMEVDINKNPTVRTDEPRSSLGSSVGALGKRWWPPLLVGVVFLLLGEVAARLGLMDAVISPPTEVAFQVWNVGAGAEIYGTTIWGALLVTLRAILIGYVIGALAGIAAGYLLGRYKMVGAIFRPYIQAFASIPKIALVPLLVLIFGIGMAAEVANVIVMVFVVVVFSTFSGVAGVREHYVDAARLMGAGSGTITFRVVLPAALPAIVIGLRSGVPFAFIGAITSEFIASSSGLGWLIHHATSQYDSTGMLSGLFYLVVSVWLFSQAVNLLQGYLLRWQRA